MLPAILCLTVLAMPLIIAVFAAFAAWAERRSASANAYLLHVIASDDIADVDGDSTLFR
jgi:hypothetical protein